MSILYCFNERLLLLGSTNSVDGQPTVKMDSELCRAKLEGYFHNFRDSRVEDRLSSIEKFAPHCEGSGYYELALASALLIARRYSDAERVAKRGLTIDGPDKTRLFYVVFKAKIAKRDFDGALVIADGVIAKFPRSDVGYMLKGEYLGSIGDFERSVAFLEEARDISPSSEIYNRLVVGYYNVGRYYDSAGAFTASGASDDSGIQELNTVLAAAASNYEIGKLEMAREILQRHRNLVPAIGTNAQFVRLMKILSKAGAS